MNMGLAFSLLSQKLVSPSNPPASACLRAGITGVGAGIQVLALMITQQGQVLLSYFSSPQRDSLKDYIWFLCCNK